MRFIIVLAFIACLIALATAAQHCPLGCKRNYKPVCGMKLVNGYWKKKTFANECEMRNENECNGGNYVSCEEEDGDNY
ncbi:vasotab isoform X2 [Halyomorpha halys]|uniref:vasotab isoform X2 n=1 Tax=Halyomorpha halys TaxID=286706 RepID=UPI0006D50293|nr:vasotab-like [Halyomorpha halys]